MTDLEVYTKSIDKTLSGPEADTGGTEKALRDLVGIEDTDETLMSALNAINYELLQLVYVWRHRHLILTRVT